MAKRSLKNLTFAQIQSLEIEEFKDRFRSLLSTGTTTSAQQALDELISWVGSEGAATQKVRAEGILPELREVTSSDSDSFDPRFTSLASQTNLSDRISRFAGIDITSTFHVSSTQSGSQDTAARLREQERTGEGSLAIPSGDTVTAAPSTDAGGDTPVSGGTVGGGGGGGGIGGIPTRDATGIGVPAGYEVWNINGKHHLVYQHDSGPFVGYRVPDAETLSRIFPDGAPTDKNLSTSEANRLGLVTMGTTNLLSTSLGESWQEGFDVSIERSASLYPWLKDPEVVATLLAAQVEGRETTQAELEATEWFGSRSDAEVQYVAFAARATKSELDQYNGQFINRVRDELEAAGLRKPPETLTRFIAHRWASGTWSEAKASEQIVAVSNPFSAIKIDAELGKIAKNFELDTLGTATRKVRDMVVEWLGPMHGNSYSTEWYEQWAGAIADDPNAENDLLDHLQGQRLSLYPNHENPKLRYADIAPVWENEMASIWGRVPDGNKDWQVVDQMIRANDATEAGQILRRTGLERGVEAVTQDAVGKALDAFGGQVVNAD